MSSPTTMIRSLSTSCTVSGRLLVSKSDRLGTESFDFKLNISELIY